MIDTNIKYIIVIIVVLIVISIINFLNIIKIKKRYKLFKMGTDDKNLEILLENLYQNFTYLSS